MFLKHTVCISCLFQVPEKTALILIEAGFRNEYKGLTKVKGKEPMKTYLILPPPLETVSCDNG